MVACQCYRTGIIQRLGLPQPAAMMVLMLLWGAREWAPLPVLRAARNWSMSWASK